MPSEAIDVINFVNENDIKFIRLSFIDIYGVQKNIAVMSNQIERVLKEGAVIDGEAVGAEKGDVCLFPDAATLHILPWRPQHGRVARFLCNMRKDGEPYSFDSRYILSKRLEKLGALGVKATLETESEFCLFKTDLEGNPSEPQDHAGYYDIAPLDKGENVRREICLALEEMGINPLSSHHEKGFGQNEIDFDARDILSACDNYMIFKAVVKAIALRNGLYATFAPKPCDNCLNGLSLKLNFSAAPDFFKNFVNGITSRADQLNIFFNSTPNSFERLASADFGKTAQVGTLRTSFARICGDSTLELRTPDGACNIYLLLSALLEAGIAGGGEEGSKICSNFENALDIAETSAFASSVFGEEFMKRYIAVKREEYDNWLNDTEKCRLEYLEKF